MDSLGSEVGQLLVGEYPHGVEVFVRLVSCMCICVQYIIGISINDLYSHSVIIFSDSHICICICRSFYLLIISVSDPSHIDVDPDPDPGIHIWEKWIRIIGFTFP